MDMLGDPWAIAKDNPIGRKDEWAAGEHQTQRKCGAIRNRNSKAKRFMCLDWTPGGRRRGYLGVIAIIILIISLILGILSIVLPIAIPLILVVTIFNMLRRK